MARETLDRKIRHLLDEILVLDSLVETGLIESVEALKKRDLELARRVYAGDSQINARRFELEKDIIITIATTQPVMAGDLRLIASILEVVGELERIGDYAKGIARITLRMGNQPPVKPLIDIPRMVEISVDMLHRAVTAFVNQDAETARQIPQEDDQVDDLYNQIYRELVAIMLSDPTTIDRANYLMWVAHNLERVADRVTNICERTVYTATGQLMEFKPSDDEIVAPI
ncbi:MAG: phosphate transport system regulatory protein PhoU [Chloroflexi bacterium RBG_16_57_11]|nr:MAG: phosphate transport system regulatory protein PhoU [Chloroflexi bacterium RBG_16_57_11]